MHLNSTAVYDLNSIYVDFVFDSTSIIYLLTDCFHGFFCIFLSIGHRNINNLVLLG